MSKLNPLKRQKQSKSGGSEVSFLAPDANLQKRAETFLNEMIDVDSQTANVEGVTRVQEMIARELKAMGFAITFKSNPDRNVKSAQLLVATLQGQSNRFITFVSHADTVMGIDDVGKYRLSADGRIAHGSGIIDNKGGLTVAVEGLRHYLESLRRENLRPQFSLRFVSSPNEESGSIGFHEEFRKSAADSVLVLGFEPALDDGSIIESRRGNRWYQVSIKGKEAHAGRCKGEEINAAHDAARKITKLARLTNIKKGLSVNVGHIEGGRDRFNVVCGEVNIKIDTRFASFESREKLHRRIEKILLKPAARSAVTGEASHTQYTIEDDCPPFSSTRDSRALLKFYLNTAQKIEGRAITSHRAGGAGDVNYMSQKGVMVLDGLGPIGGQMHTNGEFLWLNSLSSRAIALSAFLKRSEQKLVSDK